MKRALKFSCGHGDGSYVLWKMLTCFSWVMWSRIDQEWSRVGRPLPSSSECEFFVVMWQWKWCWIRFEFASSFGSQSEPRGNEQRHFYCFPIFSFFSFSCFVFCSFFFFCPDPGVVLFVLCPLSFFLFFFFFFFFFLILDLSCFTISYNIS